MCTVVLATSYQEVLGFSPSRPTRLSSLTPVAERQITSSVFGSKASCFANKSSFRSPRRAHNLVDHESLSVLRSNTIVEEERIPSDEAFEAIVSLESDENNNLMNKLDTRRENSANTESNNISINADIDPSFTPILFLCFLVTLLSALDRVAMSIAILSISDEYGFSETIKGNIASAVSYGYGLAILPVGIAVSVVNSRVLMMGGVALWSLATLGTPFMVEISNAGASLFLFPLLAARGVMGAAEAVVLPTMQRILANWVPSEKKASILGTILAGFSVGTLSAYILSPIVMDAMQSVDGSPEGIDGWRGLFYVYGMLGLLWMIPWWLLAKDAPDSNILEAEVCQESLVNSMTDDDASLVLDECSIGESTINNASSEYPLYVVKSLLLSAPWKDFAASKGVWAMTLAHAAKNWELYNLLAWTPTFFSEQYGLNIKESALFSVVPSICGMVGGLTAGNAADFILIQLEKDAIDGQDINQMRTQVRKVVQTIALLGPAVCLYSLSSLPEQASTAQFLLGGAVGLQAFDVAGFGAATQDKAGSKWSGLLYSLTSLPGVLIGSISVSVTGKLLDAVSDGTGWTTVFQLNAVICALGALCFVALYDSKREFE